MGARITKDIVMQYKNVQSIMSLKFGAQCTVEDGRTTPSLITQIFCECWLGVVLDNFAVVYEQAKS